MSKKLSAELDGLTPTPLDAVAKPVNWQLDEIVGQLRAARAEWAASRWCGSTTPPPRRSRAR
ncbi:hypothetical protein [Aquipseudomonas alcaligenes]|uniref:hypothetical protein n=1 Tax=Aquipseudomonas alcaligenes TaxID=43263 RepID=UPI001659F174|nr:hypothetical protein [Pseudomonas alcaligenes]